MTGGRTEYFRIAGFFGPCDCSGACPCANPESEHCLSPTNFHFGCELAMTGTTVCSLTTTIAAEDQFF